MRAGVHEVRSTNYLNPTTAIATAIVTGVIPLEVMTLRDPLAVMAITIMSDRTVPATANFSCKLRHALYNESRRAERRPRSHPGRTTDILPQSGGLFVLQYQNIHKETFS